MRTTFSLRRARTIRPVDGGEQRVGSIRFLPAPLNASDGQAHCVRRLMTSHACAPVLAQRAKEGMMRNLDRTVGVYDAERTTLVRIQGMRLEASRFVRVPPAAQVGVE